MLLVNGLVRNWVLMINLEESKMTNKQIYVSLSAGHSSEDCGAVA